jgi:hypothetical protein
MKRNPQIVLIRKIKSDYGGTLRTKRSGRYARPLSVHQSMHLVLRSTQATGERSLRNKRNEKRVAGIIRKFSEKFHVQVVSYANVGNHLHLQIKLGSRFAYKPFIRAIAGAIALTVGRDPSAKRFWDYRPFTRIVQGFQDHLNLQAYLSVNRLESVGVKRADARVMVGLSGP